MFRLIRIQHIFAIKMKKIPKSLLILLILSSCISLKYYGKEINKYNITDYDKAMRNAFTNGNVKTKISGTILETCAKKGCWMSLSTDADTILVRFRNYSFFVPTDGVEGKKAIVEGDLFVDTISVEMQRHYAEDAGKLKQEVEKITAPKLGLSFTADGVIIQ